MIYKPNHLLRVILFSVLLLATSCLSSTSYKCEEVDMNETYYLDSIDSGLDTDDGIYAASIKLKGFLENDIQFNNMRIASGNIDTVMNHQDQYGTQFKYKIINELGRNINLNICVSFSHRFMGF